MSEDSEKELDAEADVASGRQLEQERILGIIAEVRDHWKHCSASWVLDRLAERIKAGDK